MLAAIEILYVLLEYIISASVMHKRIVLVGFKRYRSHLRGYYHFEPLPTSVDGTLNIQSSKTARNNTTNTETRVLLASKHATLYTTNITDNFRCGSIHVNNGCIITVMMYRKLLELK